MKNIFKAITGAVLVCSVATLTGCGLLFDPDRPEIPLSTLAGFKTTYSDGTYELDDTFEKYSKHILTEIYANFAMPSTTENKSKLATPSTSSTPQNYDKIRVQVDSTNTIQNTGWKWTFSRELLGCESEYIIENYLSLNSTLQKKYFDEWTKLYTIPLEIVAIQIAMGQTPQVFTVYINDNTTTVYTDSTKSKKVDENYLAEVKAQFKTNGKYVGFTEQNVATFKNYFLNEMVGTNIVGTQYDKIVMTDGEKTYAQVFDQILALNTIDDLTKSFYTPYPASFVKDVTDNSFFWGKQNYVLDHVDAKEYQTVTMMPSKDTYIWGFYLAFEAELDLNLDVQVNFYNSKTQSVENYFNQTVNVKAGKFEEKNMVTVDLKKQLQISQFKNLSVEAITPTQISNTNQNSQFFTYSQTGTYLEGSMLECDCLTISFVPQKVQNEYCPFKWVIDLEMEV